MARRSRAAKAVAPASHSLTDRIRALERMASRGQLDANGAEALAEGYSRQATSVGVESATAARLLLRAIRLDGTNPKHAYLLALVYLAHGEFGLASHWLRVAVRHNPTSHRIWSHIAVLQRELNTRYHGNNAYEPDDLRLRAAEILRQVRLGTDRLQPDLLSFEPRETASRQRQRLERAATNAATDEDNADRETQATAPAPADEALVESLHDVRRMIDAGACRWSGAADLTLENLLEWEPGDLACQKARPFLVEAARLAPMRRGGIAAFVILGVQWCLAGFPVETVEQLRRTWPPDRETPSLRLLDCVCACLRLPPDELPSRLSAAIASNELPPTLAALIHHHCLLWQTLEPRAFLKHGAGLRWLERHARSGETDDGAAAVARVLTQAASGLAARPRPTVSDSSLGTAVAPADWFVEIAVIEQATDRIGALVRESVVIVNASDEAANLAQVLEEATERVARRLDDLLRVAYDMPPPDGWRVRADQCRRSLARLLYVVPIAARFLNTSSSGELSAEAAARIRRWTEEATTIFPDGQSAGQEDVESAAQQLGNLENDARESRTQVERDWSALQALARLKRERGLDPESMAAGHQIAARVNEIDTRSQTRIREIAQLRESGRLRDWTPGEIDTATRSGTTVPPSEIAQLATVEGSWRGVAASLGRFRRLIVQLELLKATPVQSSPVVAEAEGPRVEPAPAPEARLIGEAAVRQGLATLEAAVDARFEAALATFNGYAEESLAHPGIFALRWSVLARQAETYYRFGRKPAARRIWVQLLRSDWLSSPVRKNLAIALTGNAEHGRERTAWRDYCEVLYFQSSLARTVSEGAATRAAFHTHFGCAYAPACLRNERRDQPLTELEETELISFLNTPIRVETYVTHQRLAWLNRKLTTTTPTLVLGCERSAHENTRIEASKKLVRFVRGCTTSLTPRVREGFEKRVAEQIDNALRRCRSVHSLLEDAAYRADRERQIAWLREIVKTKLNLADAILSSKEAPRRLTSMACFEAFDRLDEAPLDLSPAMLANVHRNSDSLVRYMRILREAFLDRLTKFLAETGGDATTERFRQAQLERLTAWIERPSVRGCQAVVKFFADRLSALAPSDDHARVFACALMVLRADDRHPDVAQFALVVFKEHMAAAEHLVPHDDLDRETRGWMARARAALASNENENPSLTAEGVKTSGVLIATVLMDSIVTRLTASHYSPPIDGVSRAFNAVLQDFPEALSRRMVKYWELAVAAFKREERESGKRWAALCLQDANIVIADQHHTAEDLKVANQLRQMIVEQVGL